MDTKVLDRQSHVVADSCVGPKPKLYSHAQRQPEGINSNRAHRKVLGTNASFIHARWLPAAAKPVMRRRVLEDGRWWVFPAQAPGYLFWRRGIPRWNEADGVEIHMLPRFTRTQRRECIERGATFAVDRAQQDVLFGETKTVVGGRFELASHPRRPMAQMLSRSGNGGTAP